MLAAASRSSTACTFRTACSIVVAPVTVAVDLVFVLCITVFRVGRVGLANPTIKPVSILSANQHKKKICDHLRGTVLVERTPRGAARVEC